MKSLTLALCLAALPAMAQLTYPGGRPITCYYTDSTGLRVELEQDACLHIGSRSFMARCKMAQNVPIWRDTGEDCLTS